jgi:hypothetical protein
MHYSNSLLFHSSAPTCFDVCTSSSGSLLLCVLLSYIKHTCRFMVYLWYGLYDQWLWLKFYSFINHNPWL